jgi:ABC-type sugar transport system ATPase subunit
LLEASGISKSYGGVAALRGVDLRVHAGSAHALLGENGAGKSTLVKVIGGAVRPDAGVVHVDGREVSFSNTADAVVSGVAIVSQELNLFPDLDLLANLFPMREPRHAGLVDRGTMAEAAAPVLEELGLGGLSLRRRVGSLTLAQRQLVEIARALITQPKVLVLDEPTSALEVHGAERLLAILDVLRARQVAVLYVSHILEEVMRLCDEVTVLRDGTAVLEAAPRASLTIPQIVEAMLGEARNADPAESEVDVAAVQDRRRGTLALEDVTLAGARGVSLAVASGEVVGLAGLAGAGQEAVLQAVFGGRRLRAGRIVLPDGQRLRARQRQAIRRGVALVSGDRRGVGLMLDKPLWENVAQVREVALGASGRIVRRGPLRSRAADHVRRLRIRARSVNVPAGALSGGNQQKVVFAKWLEMRPTVLLLDDPTRGVDVGTKAEMHGLIRSEAKAGAAVLFCSTDVDEFAAVCDRVVVFFQGAVCAELSGDALASHVVLECMNTGAAPKAA